MPATLNAIEVVTLFVDDISTTKAFYQEVFEPEILFEDAVSSVLQFNGAMINLLQASEAPELVMPRTAAPSGTGPRVMFTIRVDDVDTVCASLRSKGVAMLNGPIDRPWGRRTAAFEDPSGHVWELAEVLADPTLNKS
jgi:catechol 2,3-dioxygenase-like lactoylglutathione lyase family enzyme